MEFGVPCIDPNGVRVSCSKHRLSQTCKINPFTGGSEIHKKEIKPYIMIFEKLERIGGNRVVIALSAARLGDAIGNSILFIVLPLFVAKLPAPAFPIPETVRVGLLIALFGLVNAMLQPFAGAFIDRVGRRKPFILAGLTMLGIATIGYIFASRFSDLLFLRIFQGVGVAMTIPAALALMVGSSIKETRGGSMGIYTTSRMVGLGIGPLLGGALYDRYGFNAAFYAGSAFIITAIILVQLWVKEKPAQPSGTKPVRFQIIDTKLLTAGILGVSFATLVMAGSFSMMAVLEDQFNARLNMSAFVFSLAFSALLLSRVFTQVPLGRLSDRIGRKPLIIGGLLVLAPATALLGYATSASQLIVLRLIQGLASGGVAAPAFAIAADMAQTGGEGRQMSFITMGFGLGVALGPLLAGILAVYSFTLPFIIGGLICLPGAWVIHHYVPETVNIAEQRQQVHSPTDD
ncbi:MAG: MFS transporter [Anaerolineales bacterium]|nr:MAG: MFS transporter [Anaerolineales bacterium]